MRRGAARKSAPRRLSIGTALGKDGRIGLCPTTVGGGVEALASGWCSESGAGGQAERVSRCSHNRLLGTQHSVSLHVEHHRNVHGAPHHVRETPIFFFSYTPTIRQSFSNRFCRVLVRVSKPFSAVSANTCFSEGLLRLSAQVKNLRQGRTRPADGSSPQDALKAVERCHAG